MTPFERYVIPYILIGYVIGMFIGGAIGIMVAYSRWHSGG